MILETNKDAEKGMAWWNDLSESDRLYWLGLSGSASPADAWEWFKRARPEELSFEVFESVNVDEGTRVLVIWFREGVGCFEFAIEKDGSTVEVSNKQYVDSVLALQDGLVYAKQAGARTS